MSNENKLNPSSSNNLDEDFYLDEVNQEGMN